MESVNSKQDGEAADVGMLYRNRPRNNPITFARLEKGLLLFLDIYEQSRTQLASEIALWDHQVCYDLIQDQQCLCNGCPRVHETKYRQKDLCPFWYRNSCKYIASQCRHIHHFEEVPGYHNYIRTEADADVYRLIRFIRIAVAHCFDLKIEDEDDRQDLYRQMVLIMVYLVHFLYTPSQENTTNHLDVFLAKTTMNQLIPQEDLVFDLQKPCDIPDKFFERKIDFKTAWYQRDGSTRRIEFNKLSAEFVEYFTYIMSKYYLRRLKERKTPAPWE